MADGPGETRVQVCYAMPDSQLLLDLTVPPGSTVFDAIRDSGILEICRDIDLSVLRVGIHGKLKTLDTQVRSGDRIEIYRPLLADPKDARRSRSVKKLKRLY